MDTPVKIDEIDVNIVRALQKDARTNFADIANSCSVSSDTIIKRFNKMKRNGIVRGTTLLLNPRSFGYDFVVSLEIDVNYPHVNEVVESVGKRPDVLFCTPSIGRHAVFAIVFLKNIEGLGQLKESIKKNPMVREVATSIWVDELLLCPENFEFEQA